MADDIRWQQRFANYINAFAQLEQAVEAYGDTTLDIIKEGVIQRFEFTHELAWKVMKDYLEHEGIQNVTGSRSAARHAFNIGLLEDGQAWMDMIETRNHTVHAYRHSILETEFKNIVERYYPALKQFRETMERQR
ncbi:nucleotidyltransferase [Chromohalobacter japonicus]|uniref:Nucleotidyltransferase n=2 Tax=Chromohalobacter TaxID=42054 RepID=A0A1Q8T8L7_9GAMM|nr:MULTISPECIES: nucleotidyltransferase substrate binding protein [Chromohalobacter]MCK0768125.1 nucleotidyltransferase substrate binding protein [Chromohalobacter canadensis]OLO10036.1 nucleotidyltransferase [Chromohalobacter japonicus]WQH08887.1 nucleotidyltransferase substrate binding protein [Chromohalobacter canadensis]